MEVKENYGENFKAVLLDIISLNLKKFSSIQIIHGVSFEKKCINPVMMPVVILTVLL